MSICFSILETLLIMPAENGDGIPRITPEITGHAEFQSALGAAKTT